MRRSFAASGRASVGGRSSRLLVNEPNVLPRGPRGHVLLGSGPDFGRDQLGFYGACIGNTFAMMEALLLLATIAQRFRLTLEPGQHVRPVPHISLRPESGLRMRLARR